MQFKRVAEKRDSWKDIMADQGRSDRHMQIHILEHVACVHEINYATCIQIKLSANM